jgi:hypothetical protein
LKELNEEKEKILSKFLFILLISKDPEESFGEGNQGKG